METNTHPYPALLVDESTAVFSPRLNALCSPKGVFKGTREEWLEASALIMSQWLNQAVNDTQRATYDRKKDATKWIRTEKPLRVYFADHYGGKPKDYTYQPNKVRFACSLMGDAATGMASGNALAHCHYAHATGNSYHEIRMNVTLGGRRTKDESSRVADILLHEMIHTMAVRCGHRGSFAVIARTVGLKGKLTSTVASDELRSAIWSQVVTRLGKYPHKAVKLIPRGQRKKGSRLIKCICPICEFNLRTTRKWLDKAQGHLFCPMHCIKGSTLSGGAIYQEMVTIGYEYKEDAAQE